MAGCSSRSAFSDLAHRICGRCCLTVAIIYRWRLKPGKEERFREGWRRRTAELRKEAGALGSRLHRSDDGLWVAYALWPDLASRERAWAQAPPNPAATEMMREAVAEEMPAIITEVVDDLLG